MTMMITLMVIMLIVRVIAMKTIMMIINMMIIKSTTRFSTWITQVPSKYSKMNDEIYECHKHHRNSDDTHVYKLFKPSDLWDG